MRALFDPDPDAAADEGDIAEFRRGFAAAGRDHQLILQVLIPKLVALQERGDSVAALKLIADIKRIVARREAPPH